MEDADAVLNYEDRFRVAKMRADDLHRFVRRCEVEWRIVERVGSPEGDVAEAYRRFMLLFQELQAAARLAK